MAGFSLLKAVTALSALIHKLDVKIQIFHNLIVNSQKSWKIMILHKLTN